jgi:hypothetical protein
LWWFFRAPSDGVLTLSTVNSGFDTLLAVYTGDRANALTLVGSNDDATDGSGFSILHQAVRAGQVYRIAVDGYAGQSGQVNLDYAFNGSAVVFITTQTPDGGLITPGSGYYPANTNLVFTATPGPDQEFAGWSGGITSSDNPLTVNASGDLLLIAHFRAHQPSDGFESGDFSALPWQRTGNAQWFVQSQVVASGGYAARSGDISDGQSSSLILEQTMVAGTASFDFRVSSEENWDFLEFYLNGKRLARWSGEVGWLTFSFDVPAGDNRFEWRYTKDPVNTSLGLDAAIIDNVELPRVSTGGTAVASIQLRLDDGRVQLSVTGPTDRVYRIEASSDLVHWETLSRAEALGNGGSFLDYVADAQRTRFYRLRTIP